MSSSRELGKQGKRSGSKKPWLAELLGYCVITGAMIYKVPQVVQIQRARSAKGVNFLTNLQDLASYIFAFSYSYHEGHPFSAYGENLFQGLGTLAICLQILYFEQRGSLLRLAQFGTLAAASSYVLCRAQNFFGEKIGKSLLNTLKSVTVLLSLTGKLPQVLQNFQAKAVGELSLSTSALNALGSFIRIYTVFKQLAGDVLMVSTQSISLAINSTMVFQILYYGRDGRRVD
jgi:mannose-P-dolichol utilization defect 1